MKKSTLNKSKLSKYTAVAGAVVAGGAVNAQVNYMDVNPDVVADSLNPYFLDFNNDQTPDMILAVQHLEGATSTFTYVGAFAYAYPLYGNVVTNDSLTAAAYPLDCGVPVSQASIFGSGSYGNLGYAALINGTVPFTSQGTPFLGATDKNLGFQVNGYYGWVKLDVAADASTITIKEYGYNATMGEAVNTCDQGNVGLPVNLQDLVTIESTIDGATVKVTNELLGGTLSLVSLSGQTVKTVAIDDIETSISFEGAKTGIYTVVANFEGGAVNRRVYVK
jgi:hypothetical protein